MTRDNSEQIAAWNEGASGANWSAHQTRFASVFAPLREAIVAFAQVKPGERVLDIGCGSGDLSTALARIAGPDCVTGVDISAPLLAQARRDNPGIDFIEADASTHDFAGKRFDLLASKLGIMFFADPDAAFSHLRDALSPAGRLVAATWRAARDNDAAWIPFEVVRGLLPPLPPTDPEAPGPFSFGDRERVTRILSGAGFADIEIRPFDFPMLFGIGEGRDAQLDDAVEMAFHLGPMRRLLDGQDDAVRTQACDRLRERFADKLTPDGVVLNGAAWLITARN